MVTNGYMFLEYDIRLCYQIAIIPNIIQSIKTSFIMKKNQFLQKFATCFGQQSQAKLLTKEICMTASPDNGSVGRNL